MPRSSVGRGPSSRLDQTGALHDPSWTGGEDSAPLLRQSRPGRRPGPCFEWVRRPSSRSGTGGFCVLPGASGAGRPRRLGSGPLTEDRTPDCRAVRAAAASSRWFFDLLALCRSSGLKSCFPGLENSMDCVVYGVSKSQTQPSDFHFHSSRPWSLWVVEDTGSPDGWRTGPSLREAGCEGTPEGHCPSSSWSPERKSMIPRPPRPLPPCSNASLASPRGCPPRSPTERAGRTCSLPAPAP